jgi:small subunit ribosomal protein S20
MANIKQQKKRIGIAQRQRLENLRYRSTIKTLFNRLQLNVDTGNKEAAQATHIELVQTIDRAVNRGSLHRNTAARKKARAARMLLQEPKTDTAAVRKAKKKTTPVRKPKAAATKAKASKAETAKAEATPVEAEAAEAPAAEAVDEAPVAEETAAAEDAPTADETASADEAPAGDETPTNDDA